MKNISKEKAYLEEIQKNKMKYQEEKVIIPFLEVWTGQSCTLKCRNCCHLIPYMPNKLYDIDMLIKDCKRLTELCHIEYFSVAGGEPFCNRNIYKLLDFVASSTLISKGKIVTNGTVMLEKRTMQSLINLKGKLEIHVNTYPGTEKKAFDFYRRLREYQIPARLSHYEAWKWKIMGLPGSAPCSENVAQKNFRDCWIKECNTLADGVLTACPRGVACRTVFGIEKNPFEHVRVLDYQDETEAKARIALCLSQKYEKDFCRYCMGMSAENRTEVVPGEQIG